MCTHANALAIQHTYKSRTQPPHALPLNPPHPLSVVISRRDMCSEPQQEVQICKRHLWIALRRKVCSSDFRVCSVSIILAKVRRPVVRPGILSSLLRQTRRAPTPIRGESPESPRSAVTVVKIRSQRNDGPRGVCCPEEGGGQARESSKTRRVLCRRSRREGRRESFKKSVVVRRTTTLTRRVLEDSRRRRRRGERRR